VPQFGGNIPGFGDLVPTASENTGEVLLELPPGFKYNVLIRTGNIMTDGRAFPSSADGMGAFDFNGVVRLVCNHERTTGPAIGALPYDAKAGGGTTTLTFNPATRLLTQSFVSSSGHVRNCAGGTTPWGTWLTAEESNARPSTTLNRQHGYIFEIPAFANVETEAAPLKNLGLHYPEAAVVDPKTSIVYITSDRGPCGLFRFVPETFGKLDGPGRVQMLAIKDSPNYDTRLGQKTKVKLPVSWVDIEDPSNETAYAADSLYTYKQGLAKGGATFSRGEGAWMGRNSVFFACSNGGDADMKNVYPGQEGSEWAGACFSPDGKTLFANLQGAGAVFAIWADDNKWGTIK
jgi:secreted PhoX family phosphatase